MTAELQNQGDVHRLPLPAPGKDVTYFDKGPAKDRVQGLGLRVRAAGSRRWIFFYRANRKLKRIKVGDASAMSLAEARQRARKLRVDIDDGKNPQAEKAEQRAANATTLAGVIESYLKAQTSELKPRSH